MMAGGAFLTFAGALTSYTGIGFGGVAAGTVTGLAGMSDIEQGVNEIRLGWKNDSTTKTRNLVRDILYDGDDTIYHLSTGMAAMAGLALKPYVIAQRNPVLAGGEQTNIAEKAAMGADGAAGGVEGGSKTISDIIDNLPETTNGRGIARNFESSGGFNETLKDFESLNPIDVKEIQTQYGLGRVGKLSDGTIVVARPGSTTGGATLEIRISNSKVYKIRY